MLVLGDLVGYGADPNAVIDRVRALKPVAMVRGNHDKVALGLDQAEGFNAAARAPREWTLDALTPEHREWLAGAAAGTDGRRRLRRDLPRLAVRRGQLHLRRARRAAAPSRAPRGRCASIGHTHYAVAFELDGAGRSASIGRRRTGTRSCDLKPGGKYLVNPDRSASRATAIRAPPTPSSTRRRQARSTCVRLDVSASKRRRTKMSQAGLPEPLARRLRRRAGTATPRPELLTGLPADLPCRPSTPGCLRRLAGRPLFAPLQLHRDRHPAPRANRESSRSPGRRAGPPG